jgi:hypothetical protein
MVGGQRVLKPLHGFYRHRKKGESNQAKSLVDFGTMERWMKG